MLKLQNISVIKHPFYVSLTYLKIRNRHFIKAIFGSFETAIFGSFETAFFGSFETAIFGSIETAIFGSFETESWLEDRKIFRFQKPFLCSFDTPQKRCFKTSSMPAFWNPKLWPQKDIVVCINGFLVVLELMHTRSFETSFPYLWQ